MFLNKKVLNKLMKEAYKSGLIIANREDKWIYIAGRYWEVEMKRECIPKEILGDIISLVGNIPDPGERYLCTAEGNQLEIGKPMEITREAYTEGPLTITDTLQIGSCGTVQRFLQDDSTGAIYLVNQVYIDLSKGNIDEENGEYAPYDPFYCSTGLLWQTNMCRIAATFRHDMKNTKIINALKGVDITPDKA